MLRLVGETPHRAAPPPSSSRAGRADRREAEVRLAQVRRENHAAALRFDLDPNDPRWILAVRTRSELQGAALPAERRRRLLGLAQRLGLRPFDANLVIAIVQDEARSACAGGTLADRLRVVPERRMAAGEGAGDAACPARESRCLVMIVTTLSLLCGAAGLLWLVRWLNAG